MSGSLIIRAKAKRPDERPSPITSCPPEKQLIGDKNPMMAKIVIETLAQTLLATDEFNKAIVKFTEQLEETHKFRKNIGENHGLIINVFKQPYNYMYGKHQGIVKSIPRDGIEGG